MEGINKHPYAGNKESMESPSVLVSVAVLTYNQEDYIADCLNSIIAQQTDFSFEIIVGDDHSTDNTPYILQDYAKKYPSLFSVITHETNVGISENYKRVFCACTGKYIAICEGDDFWIDTHKLSDQVSFLETHPSFSFVGAYVNILKKNKFFFDPYNYLPAPKIEGEWELYGDVFYYAKYGVICHTVTICFRKEIIDPYIAIPGIGNDLVLQTILSKYGEYARLNRIVSVYRIAGISHSPHSLEKTKRYSDWRYDCLQLQKQLFPESCDWDEDAMSDIRYFPVFQYYIKHLEFRKAKEIRSLIKSKRFTKKPSYRYSYWFVPFVLLSLFLNIKSH